jgi:hypothetical protein
MKNKIYIFLFLLTPTCVHEAEQTSIVWEYETPRYETQMTTFSESPNEDILEIEKKAIKSVSLERSKSLDELRFLWGQAAKNPIENNFNLLDLTFQYAVALDQNNETERAIQLITAVNVTQEGGFELLLLKASLLQNRNENLAAHETYLKAFEHAQRSPISSSTNKIEMIALLGNMLSALKQLRYADFFKLKSLFLERYPRAKASEALVEVSSKQKASILLETKGFWWQAVSESFYSEKAKLIGGIILRTIEENQK